MWLWSGGDKLKWGTVRLKDARYIPCTIQSLEMFRHFDQYSRKLMQPELVSMAIFYHEWVGYPSINTYALLLFPSNIRRMWCVIILKLSWSNLDILVLSIYMQLRGLTGLKPYSCFSTPTLHGLWIRMWNITMQRYWHALGYLDRSLWIAW